MATGPEYLDEVFLKSTLEDGLDRNDVKVIGYEANLISIGGENYFSDIYRVKVDYKLEEDDDKEPKVVHLILKAMKGMIDFSSKEAPMYREVIPVLESILGNDIQFGPKLYTEVSGEYELFVFEDLNALGYKLKDREQGLSEADCILVLKKIAKFHAASMVFAQEFPEVIDKIKFSMFEFGTKGSPSIHNHMTGMLDSAAEAVSGWEGYESVAEKLFGLKDQFHDRAIETLDRTKTVYNVINHGDLWINNVLFKDDDLLFVDFQISHYSSPGIDLHYFLSTSVPLETLKSKRYEFYRIYFKEFQETLKNVGYDGIPTWDEFVAEMKRTELSALWVMLTIFPMMALNKEDSKGNDIDAMRNLEVWAEKKKKMFATERVVEMFKYALDRFIDLSVL